MSNDNFQWTDELVLMVIDMAHHNGYHKFKQRCVELFDEVKNQASGSGYKYPEWITKHIEASKQQPIKEKIFTTQDGVDIYAGGQCWTVNTKNLWKPIHWTEIPSTLEDVSWDRTNEIYFSTKEKGEEYILLNKPCLSVQDIFNSHTDFQSSYYSILKELANQKILL